MPADASITPDVPASGMTRRRLLRRACLLSAAALPLPLSSGCGDAAGPPCADPELLGAGERQMRATLDYVERTADPAQRCDGCQFYAAGEGGCGHCEILGGAVSAAGWCTSWAARR